MLRSRNGFRFDVNPEISEPVPNQTDEIGHRPEGTQIAAPRPSDEQRGDKDDSQKDKQKIRPDKPEESTKDLVAGNSRIAVNKGNDNSGKGQRPL